MFKVGDLVELKENFRGLSKGQVLKIYDIRYDDFDDMLMLFLDNMNGKKYKGIYAYRFKKHKKNNTMYY